MRNLQIGTKIYDAFSFAALNYACILIVPAILTHSNIKYICICMHTKENLHVHTFLYKMPVASTFYYSYAFRLLNHFH